MPNMPTRPSLQLWCVIQLMTAARILAVVFEHQHLSGGGTAHIGHHADIAVGRSLAQVAVGIIAQGEFQQRRQDRRSRCAGG